MKLKNATIRQRLMMVILLTCGTVLTISCLAYFTYDFITVRKATVMQLKTMGEIIAANSTAALTFQIKEDANEILNSLRADKHIVAACLYDKDGRIFSFYPKNFSPYKFPTPPFNEGYYFKNRQLRGFQPILLSNTRLGTLYLISDLDVMYARLRLYALIILFITMVSFGLAYLLSLRLRETILKPIFSLVETSGKITTRGEYSFRAKKYREDELGSLTDAFNTMLDRIEFQNEEIMAFNLGLEGMVANRTMELEMANNILKEQKEFVETIINSSVDTIAVFNKNLEFVVINQHTEKIYKISKEAIVGKHVLDLFPQVKISGMYNDLLKALKGEPIHKLSYRSVVVNRYFETYYIPLKDVKENVYGVLVIGHDITDIIEANEKLKILNTQLVKSNLELEQFAYIASHDLQEPLRKIQVFSELVMHNLHKPDEAKMYFGKINSSASRMAELIKAVLNYSRLSKSGEVYTMVDLNIVLENIKTDLELIINEKDALITSPRLPFIEAIPFQMNQLFLNLLSNSLKFADRKPQISISTNLIAANELTEYLDKNINDQQTEPPIKSNYIELIFQDNGIGFELQYTQQIFTIFKRLHSNKNYTGTGIGLALVKKIVENHNGFIKVTSSPGEGSSFYIYMPTHQNHLLQKTDS
ncbi:MAG: ATP-binding protein [Ferruginibacter sp.]